MHFQKVTPAILQQLKKIAGDVNVFTDDEKKIHYGHDETEDLSFLPEVVLKPSCTEEISEILKVCNREHIPVTPIGGRTGLSGGALPVFGGVTLSTERLNKILLIDEKNLQATVEPGVITQVFQEAVIEKGLFYPPDPSSRGSCFLGGNIAENAGGPRAVKYGVTRDYVLNLEVVLPDGEIIWTGANVLKNSTGYSLTQLMVGSEGTLGIITKIVFKLLPYPKQNLLMLVPFFSAGKACEAVSAVFRAGIIPSTLEFMEKDAVDWVIKFTGLVPPLNIEKTEALLLVEVDGNDPAALIKDCEQISEVVQLFQCGEILLADSAEQKETLWKIRRRVGEAVKSNSVYKEEDTVVPRYELPKLLSGIKEIGKKYGFKTVCYGHAGDGNLHVNIIKGELSEDQWNNSVSKGIREIFALTKSLGGTLSGEHGIGWVQKPYLDIVFSKTEIELRRKIKSVFDPNGILNPGKIFASDQAKR